MKRMSKRTLYAKQDEDIHRQIRGSSKPQIPKEDSLDIYEILILITERLDAIEDRLTKIEEML